MTTIEASGRTVNPWQKASVYAGRRVHLIGVGGAGMAGAARMLARAGATVSGTDMNPFEGSGQLVREGVAVQVGHAAGHLDADVQLVIRSAAVPDTNSEVVAARAAGIPVIHYAEWLGEMTRIHTGVAIAGSHGKSTTTALTAFLYRSAGLDPSFILGAHCDQLEGSSGAGRGEYFVVESCEYNRSFLHLHPRCAAILNLEADHLDCYRNLDELVDAFGAFAGQVAPEGTLLVNHDDRVAKRAARKATCEVETFGFGPGAHWRAVNLRSQRGHYAFRVTYRGRQVMTCRLQLAGLHNVANALAAIGLARAAGAAPEAIESSLARFEGVRRRMSVRGTAGGITIVDDYAHHPTEIRATLRAARDRFARRMWVVFQPHQASRTRLLLDEFSASFGDADEVLVPDIYTVRDSEADRAAVTAQHLVEGIRGQGKAARYAASLDEACVHLSTELQAGDLVMTMGAGDVYRVADGLVERVC